MRQLSWVMAALCAAAFAGCGDPASKPGSISIPRDQAEAPSAPADAGAAVAPAPAPAPGGAAVQRSGRGFD